MKEEKKEGEERKEKSKQEREQEKFLRLALLEQEIKGLEQQLLAIEQQLVELQLVRLSLEDLASAKEGEELLAGLGKGIFVRTKLIDKELFVDVGSKTVLKKSISEAKTILDKDIKKKLEARNAITKEIEEIVRRIEEIRY